MLRLGMTVAIFATTLAVAVHSYHPALVSELAAAWQRLPWQRPLPLARGERQAELTPVAPIALLPPPPEPEHFSVEVGRFVQQQEADRLARELVGQGLEAFVRPETDADDPAVHYRVYCGRHPDAPAAQQSLEKLGAAWGHHARVVALARP